VSKALKAVTVHSLFGPRPVVEGEDAAAYDELFGRVCAAVKPADVIDEILVADLVALEWEVLRWRRLKSSLIQVSALKALKGFLEKQLGYDLYREQFEHDLAEFLRANRVGDTQDVARLARHCAWNDPGANAKVDALLDRIETHRDYLQNKTKARKAEQLVQEYSRRKPGAVRLIDKLLARAGVNIDVLIVQDLREKELDYIERMVSRPSPRLAATPACARLSAVGPSSAKQCAKACKNWRAVRFK